MPRKIAALLVIFACTLAASPAFAAKGFFIGGGASNTSASGDLDGKHSLTNSTGTLEGNLGKLDNGGGLDFDIGYMFNRYFGLEYVETYTAHDSSHQNEPTIIGLAGVDLSLAGIRLAAPLGDHFNLFARLGAAFGTVTYPKYGHKGTTTSGVFTATSNETFTVSGAGTGFGAGFEIVFGKHLGMGLGVTTYNLSLDTAAIGSTSAKVKHPLSETFSVSDFTVLWHL